MSTAYRISDGIEGRTMEFRKRVLHPGAAIGPHRIAHDEVYYVLDGAGEVVSDGERRALSPGSAAYLFDGAVVGITQKGARPLTPIIDHQTARGARGERGGREGEISVVAVHLKTKKKTK